MFTIVFLVLIVLSFITLIKLISSNRPMISRWFEMNKLEKVKKVTFGVSSVSWGVVVLFIELHYLMLTIN